MYIAIIILENLKYKFRKQAIILHQPTTTMSATDVMQTLPMPVPFAEGSYKKPDPILMAPKRRATKRRIVPMETTEKDSVSDLFEDTFVEEAEPWDKDPMKNLERVFFDNQTDTLYKLFIDGSWESLKFNVQ